MTTKIALRLVLLFVIILAGLSYIILSVLQYRIGTQPFVVSVQMQRAGGLFPGAYVAYRGVDVGRVASLHLDTTGVTAKVKINPGTKIPTNSEVNVHDLSAVGEQYANFVPRTSDGPYLRGGSVIPKSSTTVPIPVSTILTNIGSFTNSINTAQLANLLQSASTALNGSGPQLRTLVSSTENIAADLESVQPQTNQLIDQGNVLLHTGEATNDDVATFSAQLAQLTSQLDTSDASIRSVLNNGSTAADQLTALLKADTPVTESLAGHAATVANVTATHNSAVVSLLQVLPVVAENFGQTASGGELHAHFFLNDNEPTCSYGPPLGEPTSVTPPSVNLNLACNTSNPTLQQRGVQNLPEPSK